MAYSFKYISVKDLLEDKVKSDELESKIVIMGSSAPGLRDQRSTPLQNVFPGVEIHANLIDGILGNHVKQMPAWGHALEFILLIVAGIGFSLLIPLLGPISSFFVASLFILMGLAFNFYLWEEFNFVLPTASALSVVVMVFVTDTSIAYFMEGRQQKNMTSLFGQYVPPELVKKMAEDPLKYSMEGRDADLSVLFSDVRGFTGISEKLTAVQLSSYINEYLTTMSKLISEESGTLDKYIGDAIMAFWGAPIENSQHAFDSVSAALKMAKKADELSASFAARNLPPFSIGIGINSGHMRVGDMGSKYRRAYTVMGDSVNLASRLESLTKNYGVMILVGESVVKAAPEFFYREVDRVKVKGKDQNITIYTPLGPMHEVITKIKEEVSAWEIALYAYYEGDWDKAITELDKLNTTFGPQKIYEVYLERCVMYKKTPPPKDWGGVFVFTEK
jgi:adenylate cyclase